MKNKILLLLLLALPLLFSCKSEEDMMRINLADDALRFEPAPGGAVMHYALPDDPDIVGIHVRYNDCYGKPMLRTGSIYSDTLTITGFNEAVESVQGEVTMQMRDGSESAPIACTFSTLDSQPVTFLKTVSMDSGWNGFSLSYGDLPGVKGIYNVFYLGVNPYTQATDTILLDTQQMFADGDTIVYVPQQGQTQYTTIVRAEDYRGHIIGERTFDVETMELAKRDGIKVYYANSYESDEQKVGVEYLTDGDTNGWRWYESEDPHKFYTFVSRPNAFGENSEPMYVDLGEQLPVGSVRIYGYLKFGPERNEKGYLVPCFASNSHECGNLEENVVGQLCGSILEYYYTHLPSKLDIYGCKEPATSTDFENMKWDKLSSIDNDPYEGTKSEDGIIDADESCWYKHCSPRTSLAAQTSGGVDAIKALKPAYEEATFAAVGQKEGYRYLKIVFKQRYWDEWEDPASNRFNVLSFNELEVYTKKD